MEFWDGLVKDLAGATKTVTPPWMSGMIPPGGPAPENERMQERLREVNGRTAEAVAHYRAELETYRQLVYGSSYFLVLGNGIFIDDDSFVQYSSAIDKYSQDPRAEIFSSKAQGRSENSATLGIPVPHDPDELPGRAASLSARAARSVPHLDRLSGYLRGDPGAADDGAFGPQSAARLVDAGRACGIIAAAPEASITEKTVGPDVTVDAVQDVLTRTSLIGLAAPGMEFLRVIGLGRLFGERSAPNLQKIGEAIEKTVVFLQELENRRNHIRSLSGREIEVFREMIGEISEISGHQPLDTPDSNTREPRSFPPVMERATGHYSTFIDIRDAWVKARRRNPAISAEEFAKDLRVLWPTDLSEETILRCLSVLSRYSGMIPQPTGATVSSA